MKQLISVFIIIILSFPGLSVAKPEKNQIVILLEKAQEGENVGSLEKLLDDPELAKRVKLVGQARMFKNKGSNKTIAQIVWTGVQNKDGNKRVALDKPLVSAFKFKHVSETKGSQLSVDGELEILLKAVKQLENGDFDKEKLKNKQVAKNPSKKGRFVEVGNKADRRKSNLDRSDGKSNSDRTVIENVDPYTQTNKNASSESGQGSSSTKGSNTKSGDMGKNASETSLNSTNNQNVTSKKPNKKSSSRGQLVVGTNQALGGLQPVAPSERTAEQPREQNAPEPTRTSQVTENGCQPRIDRVHERVTIQNRAIKLENNQVVEEGPCTDSMETYPIMKDYLCEGCTDEVNNDERRAYARYQEFWFDRDNHRLNIGDTIYTDRTRHYDFFYRTTHCPLSVDLDGRLVYTQRETGYLNRSNVFVALEACHRIPNQTPIPITETYERCNIVHDFVNNISYDQVRLIFKKDDIEHEVRGCQQHGNGMAHQFVETGCQRAVDLLNGRITPMYRRQITVIGRFLQANQQSQNRIITDECEPGQEHGLQVTREGCVGQFIHDLAMGRSYLKKRYYYQNDGREYVTGCVRVNDYLQHKTQGNGEWVHDDANRISRPKLSLYIDTGEEPAQLVIEGPKVRGDLGLGQYTFVRNEHRATADYYFEGCFRRTRTQSVDVYNRPDNTAYELVIGAGNPILSTVDECQRTEESREVQIGTSGGNVWRHARPVMGTQKRIITKYPDDTVVTGVWK